MEPGSKWVLLISRICLGLIFLISGLGKISNFTDTAALMASKGVPATSLLLVVAIALELFGSISLLTGFKTRWGTLALLIFLVPVTLVFHNFWAYVGPQQREQMNQFLKNLAILGGLLALWASGPGPVSLDAKLARASR